MMLELFLIFAKIGVMTFGGGLAMLPMLERELVDNKHWVEKDELMDYYALGQCTPGIIAVNVATLVGRKEKGFWGAIASTAGIVFPSVVIITILAAFFAHFAENELVVHAFAGARAAVCVLVLNSVVKLGKSALKDFVAVVLYIAIAVIMIVFKANPIVLVLSAALIGVVYKRVGGNR